MRHKHSNIIAFLATDGIYAVECFVDIYALGALLLQPLFAKLRSLLLVMGGRGNGYQIKKKLMKLLYAIFLIILQIFHIIPLHIVSFSNFDLSVRGEGCARALPLTRLRTFSKVLRNPKIFGKRVKTPILCIGNRLNGIKASRLSWGESPLK
jgi:hypothetical protein